MLSALALVLGIDLGQVVPESALISRYAKAPATASLLTPAQADVGEWYQHQPPTLPAFFTGIEGEYAVQLDLEGRALSVHASFDQACGRIGGDVLTVLQRKYGAAKVPSSTPATTKRRDFETDQLAIGYRCDEQQRLQLSYRHKRRFRNASRLHDGTNARAVKEAAALLKGRRRQQADRLARGTRQRLFGVLGIPFSEPVPLEALQASIVPSQIGELTPLTTSAPAPFSEGALKVKMQRSRKPYHIEATIKREDAPALFQELAAAFAVKYGSPYTGGKTRRVYRINGDLLSISHRDDTLRLLAVQQVAAKEAAAEIRQQAADDYQRKTAGL